MISTKQYEVALAIVKQYEAEEKASQELILEDILTDLRKQLLGATWNEGEISNVFASYSPYLGSKYSIIEVEVEVMDKEGCELEVDEEGIPAAYDALLRKLSEEYGKKLKFPYWYSGK